MKRITVCPKCGSNLENSGGALKCLNNHSYDIAKQGYVNLMLGSSKAGGDDKEMCRARHKFHSCDYYKCLSERLACICTENKFRKILDAGCGDGYYIRKIRDKYAFEKLSFEAICGIDLAKEAILVGASAEKTVDMAQRIEYAVAGIFDMPVSENSVDCVLSVFAPVPEKEAARVLRDGGVMIVVSPGEKHLEGLKKILYENTYDNTAQEKNYDGFTLCKREFLSDTVTIEGDNVGNLFHMTPYYWKTSYKDAEKLEKLNSLSTKIEFVVSFYKKN